MNDTTFLAAIISLVGLMNVIVNWIASELTANQLKAIRDELKRINRL